MLLTWGVEKTSIGDLQNPHKNQVPWYCEQGTDNTIFMEPLWNQDIRWFVKKNKYGTYTNSVISKRRISSMLRMLKQVTIDTLKGIAKGVSFQPQSCIHKIRESMIGGQSNISFKKLNISQMNYLSLKFCVCWLWHGNLENMLSPNSNS